MRATVGPRPANWRSGSRAWRISAGDVEGTFSGMRIGTILRPAVLLALVDSAILLQHPSAQPRSVRIASRLSFVMSIEITPARTNPSARRSFRAVSTGRDSELAELMLVHLFQLRVHKNTAGRGYSSTPAAARVAAGGLRSSRVHLTPGEIYGWWCSVTSPSDRLSHASAAAR